MNTVTLDFETFYGKKYSLSSLTYEEYIFDPRFKIHCCGFKVNDERSYIVWGHLDVIAEVQRLFPPGNENVAVIQNALFDGPIVSWVCKATPVAWIDTRAIAKLLYPFESSSLSNMARLVLGKEKGKELVNFKDVVDIPEADRFMMKRYCLNDVELTYSIYLKLERFVPHSQMTLIHLTTDMYVSRPLRVNKELLKEFIKDEEKETDRLVKASGLPRSVLASTKKFGEWIIDNGMSFNKVLSPTTSNPDNMKWPLGKDCEEFADLRLRYPEYEHVWAARVRVASNISVTRAKRFLSHSRYHPHYNTDEALGAALICFGAHTHRWSGANRTNFQNLTRKSTLRLALMAEEGRVLVVHDQKQLEARVLAWLARCNTLTNAYKNGDDVYAQFATTLYNRPIDPEKDAQERFVGKVCILGLGYQMGARRLHATLKAGALGPPVFIPMEECETAVKTFRSTYWEIPQLWNTAQNMLNCMVNMDAGQSGIEFCGCLVVFKNAIMLPDNTLMQFPNLHFHYANEEDRDEGFRYWNGKYMASIYGGKLVENIVQALANIIIAGNALEAFRFPSAKIALLVHDELVASLPETDAQRYFEHMVEVMRKPPVWADSSLALDVEGGYAREYSK